MTRAIVLAGGFGTRMAPLTAHRPKHLLEVAGEPFLAHQLRWLAGHGVDVAVLATSYRAELFEPVFGPGSDVGLNLRYAVEPEPLGTGGALAHAIAALPETAPEDPIVVVNGDHFTRHDLGAQLAVLAGAPEADAVLLLRTVADATAYGSVVADAGGIVSAFVEKSPDPPSQEVNGGTYVLRRRVIDAIGPGVVSLEREVLPRLVAAGGVRAYREQADWIDVGTPAALVLTSAQIVRSRGLERIIGAGATVDPSAIVDGGSVIGADAHVGAGAAVHGCVLMPGASVGAGARVRASVLGRGAVLGPGAALEAGALGDAERFPSAATAE